MHTSHDLAGPASSSLRGARKGLARLAGAGVGIAGLAALAGLATAVPAGASSGPTTVKATETEFHISLSKNTFSPGKYTFVAVNKGHVTHALMITGPGLSDAKTKDIAPGHSAKLTVTFEKGAYDVFCPVPGHKMLGMNVNLTVGGGAAATNTAHTSHPSHTTTTKANSGGYGY